MAPSLYLFLVIYMISFGLVLGCDDWFMMWLGLEINMMSFIVLVYSRSSVLGVDSCMKYFFVQSLGSAIYMMLFYIGKGHMEMLGILVLSYKLGGGPFFFWFPSVCEGLEWGSCFVLMTAQKIVPLWLITMMVSYLVWGVIISSLVIGAVGSFNQNSVKRLMAYSSIHHVGWLMLCLIMNLYLWVIYLILYSIMLGGLILLLQHYDVVLYKSFVSVKNKWVFVFNMMSLGGVPPLVGFFLKWEAFYGIMLMDYSVLLLMVLMSLIMLYVYLRLCYDMLMVWSSEVNWVIESGVNSSASMALSMWGLILGPVLGIWLVI